MNIHIIVQSFEVNCWNGGAEIQLMTILVLDVDVDVEEIRAQTNNCLYARS